MNKPLGEEPKMSASTSTILSKVRRLIPPMLERFHKGQLGRVAVIGGSQDYTGAPYFSAMASARLGCDMSHVICTPAAANVIKTYSPNLMVHPLMRQTSSSSSSAPNNATEDDPDAITVAKSVIEMLSRIHVLVVGPGLGRDKLMQDTASHVIKAARERNMPVIIDADALQIVQSDMDIIRGYKQAILTPNVVEFERLCKAANIDPLDPSKDTRKVELLAEKLGGVTIIQKGPRDYISNGSVTMVNDLEGGRKRSGGQGDTLTGAIATFMAWRKAYIDGLWNDDKGKPLTPDEMLGLAVFGGSAITRECSRLAFIKRGRSLQASDLTDEVHNAFLGLFGEVDDDGKSSRL